MTSRPVVGVSLKAYFDRSRLSIWLEEVARRACDEDWSADVDVFVLPDLLGVPAAVAALAETSWAPTTIPVPTSAATAAGLVPLVCVGEDSGGADAATGHCRGQLATALGGCPPDQEALVAYEPVWAIGAPEAASPEHVRRVLGALRAEFGDRPLRYLYGGSAGPGVLGGLGDGVDGLFLGRFAHDPAALSAVVDETRRAPTKPS